jgi:hypothetical protein
MCVEDSEAKLAGGGAEEVEGFEHVVASRGEILTSDEC